MITERADERRNDALLWAIGLSLLAHLILIPIIAWLSAWHLAIPMRVREPELIVSSSSVRIERRARPQPRSIAVRPAPPPQQPTRSVQPHPQAQPREIARIAPQATPQQSTPKPATRPADTLSQQLAQQQRQFERETARLRAQNNPLSVATLSPQAAAPKRYAMDISGMQGENPGEGFLFPTSAWREGNANCYYGRYLWEYPDGATERAAIPWPFCYARGKDPIAAGLTRFPFPLPPDGFTLPPGTYLAPEARKIYDLWKSAGGG